MNTFVGIDFHKQFSFGTIMTPAGDIIKRQRFTNSPEALEGFPGEHAGEGCARRRCLTPPGRYLMPNWPRR